MVGSHVRTTRPPHTHTYMRFNVSANLQPQCLALPCPTSWPRDFCFYLPAGSLCVSRLLFQRGQFTGLSSLGV